MPNGKPLSGDLMLEQQRISNVFNDINLKSHTVDIDVEIIVVHEINDNYRPLGGAVGAKLRKRLLEETTCIIDVYYTARQCRSILIIHTGKAESLL
ncbi:hypothetical protein J6590_089822 [Homalodisca vitripennis]|nr:hypothetical protein J6590_089822 [Homalodisca vitripennis]